MTTTTNTKTRPSALCSLPSSFSAKHLSLRTQFAHLILLYLAIFLLCPLAEAKQADDEKNPDGKIVESKFFDKQMSFTDELYVLHDVLEFSVFDISEVEIVDESGSAKVEFTAVDAEGETKPQEVANLSGKDEIQKIMPEIPKFYYMSLKKEILARAVPVTLFPKNPPSYAKPIKLAIKLKKIHLKPIEVNDEGNYVQPVEMKIYGQLKEKKTDRVLTRFYDSDSAKFVLGSGPDALRQALSRLSQDMMQDFSGYLKTRY